MNRLSFCIAVTIILAAIGPAWAQAPWQPQGPYSGGYYPFPALTPSDAYRQHLINRWELEQLEGPLPQALQGPSPNGDTGFDK